MKSLYKTKKTLEYIDIDYDNIFDNFPGFTGPQGPTGSSATIDVLSSNETEVILSKSIIPDTNAQYDLGDSQYKIRHLYLSDNSLYVGDNRISNNPETNSIKINKLEIGEELILNNIRKEDYEKDMKVEEFPVLRINPDTGKIYY